MSAAAITDESQPQRALQSLAGGCCRDCGHRFSARDAVCSIFLGLKDAPRCLACLGRRLDRPPEELRSDLLAHIRARDCYLRAWRDAERIDEVVDSEAAADGPPLQTEAASGDMPAASAEWNAGDMGCGDLVMALRLRLRDLQPGDIIRVTATDPAAPEDLPAWCRLCGHQLVSMNHPDYWIQRRKD